MELNVDTWAEFKIGDLFTITRGQRLIADDREPGDIPYFSASDSNNGKTDSISNPLFIEHDALIYSTFGDCYYVKGEFTASDEISILKHTNMTEVSGLFIAMIMKANKYKYQFGRKAFQNKFINEFIKLPATAGGEPDWQFMEDYIKSLHHKPLTTQNVAGQAPDLNVQDWEEFSLVDLFGSCERGTRITTLDRIEGNIPFCTAGEFNEGISELIGNSEAKTYCNALTIDMFANCYYHDYDFKCDDNVLVITNEHINKFTGLFISQIIMLDKDKNSYGRQYRQKDYARHIIKLPATSAGEPDWQFMEDYIKSLPYGDRL